MYLVQELDSIHSTSAGECFALKKVGLTRLDPSMCDRRGAVLSTEHPWHRCGFKLQMLHMCLPVAVLCVSCTACQVIRRRAADSGCYLRPACRGSTGDIRHVQGGPRQHPAPPSLHHRAHHKGGGASAHRVPALSSVRGMAYSLCECGLILSSQPCSSLVLYRTPAAGLC